MGPFGLFKESRREKGKDLFTDFSTIERRRQVVVVDVESSSSPPPSYYLFLLLTSERNVLSLCPDDVT
jgi:hypothetical protein